MTRKSNRGRRSRKAFHKGNPTNRGARNQLHSEADQLDAEADVLRDDVDAPVKPIVANLANPEGLNEVSAKMEKLNALRRDVPKSLAGSPDPNMPTSPSDPYVQKCVTEEGTVQFRGGSLSLKPQAVDTRALVRGSQRPLYKGVPTPLLPRQAEKSSELRRGDLGIWRMVDKALDADGQGRFGLPPWWNPGFSAEEWAVKCTDTLSIEAAGLMTCARTSQVFVADNVAEWFYCGNDQEVWDLERDVPAVVPPFGRMWIEWKEPGFSLSRELGLVERPTSYTADYYGVAWEAYTFEEYRNEIMQMCHDPEYRRVALNRHRLFVRLAEQQMNPSRVKMFKDLFANALKCGSYEVVYQEVLNGATANGGGAHQLTPVEIQWLKDSRWVTYIQLGRWMELVKQTRPWKWHHQLRLYVMSGDLIVGPMWQWHFRCDGQGQVLQGSCETQRVVGPHGMPQFLANMGLDERMAKSLHYYVFPAVFCIAFANCKNVATDTVPPKKSVANSLKKLKRNPPVTYNVVRIGESTSRPAGLSEQEKEEIAAGGERGRRRLHICRGHLATYSAEKPLFGQPWGVGTFYRPAHKRGSSSEGVAYHDYEGKKR